jgi:hypothetical protein
MNKIYLVIDEVQYEGSDVLSAHKSFDTALKAAETAALNKAIRWRMDSSEITKGIKGNSFHLDDRQWVVVELEILE